MNFCKIHSLSRLLSPEFNIIWEIRFCCYIVITLNLLDVGLVHLDELRLQCSRLNKVKVGISYENY